jgi:hypothetical protein
MYLMMDVKAPMAPFSRLFVATVHASKGLVLQKWGQVDGNLGILGYLCGVKGNGERGWAGVPFVQVPLRSLLFGICSYNTALMTTCSIS